MYVDNISCAENHIFCLMKLIPIPLIDDPLNDGQNKASMKPTDVYGNIED